MSKIHPTANESLDSALDLFSLPTHQTSIEDGKLVELFPIATLAQGSPIEFVVLNSSENEYLDFSESFLLIKVRVVNADGAVLPADAPVAPIANFMHSLFSQVDVSLNNVLVSSSNPNYALRAYLENFLSQTTQTKEGVLSAQLFAPDTPGQHDRRGGDENEGLRKRRQASANSRVISLIGKLHTDFGTCPKYLLNEVNIKLRLTPSKPEFHLIAGGGDNPPQYKSEILHASFFAKKVKVNPAVFLAIEKALMRNTAKYPMKRALIKTFSVAQGQLSAVADHLFLGALPTKLTIGLVKSVNFLGSIKTNPFNFEHFGLNYLSVSVDGKQIPAKPYTPNFTEGDYSREYYANCQGTGQLAGKTGIGLSYEDFSKGYTIFVVDLTPGHEDTETVELVKSGALRLEMKFNEALRQPIHVIVQGEVDSLIEIDRSRTVITDFST